MKYLINIILFLLLLLNSNYIFCQYLTETDLIGIAKKITIAEFFYENILVLKQSYSRVTRQKIEPFELNASDSIIRQRTLEDFESLSDKSFLEIKVDSIFEGYTSEKFIGKFKIFEILVKNNDSFKPKKYALAINKKGEFYYLQGYKYNDFKNFYKSFFKKINNFKDALYVATIYLHYIEEFPLNMIAKDKNIKQLKYYYNNIFKPDTTGEFDNTIFICAVGYDINGYHTYRFMFTFSEDSLEVDKQTIYVKEEKPPFNE